MACRGAGWICRRGGGLGLGWLFCWRGNGAGGGWLWRWVAGSVGGGSGGAALCWRETDGVGSESGGGAVVVSGGVRSFAGDGAREVGYELGSSGAGVSAGDGVGEVGYGRGGGGRLAGDGVLRCGCWAGGCFGRVGEGWRTWCRSRRRRGGDARRSRAGVLPRGKCLAGGLLLGAPLWVNGCPCYRVL